MRVDFRLEPNKPLHMWNDFLPGTNESFQCWCALGPGQEVVLDLERPLARRQVSRSNIERHLGSGQEVVVLHVDRPLGLEPEIVPGKVSLQFWDDFSGPNEEEKTAGPCLTTRAKPRRRIVLRMILPFILARF